MFELPRPPLEDRVRGQVLYKEQQIRDEAEEVQEETPGYMAKLVRKIVQNLQFEFTGLALELTDRFGHTSRSEGEWETSDTA